MKKTISMLSILLALILLAACGEKSNPKTQQPENVNASHSSLSSLAYEEDSPQGDLPETNIAESYTSKYTNLSAPEKVTLIHAKIGYNKENDITITEITDKEEISSLFEGLKFENLSLSNSFCRCMPEYYIDFHNGYAMLLHSHGDAYYVGEKVVREESDEGIRYSLWGGDSSVNFKPINSVHTLIMSYFSK